MKLVIQRVKNAEVNVEENQIAKIEKGFLVLLGVAPTDNDEAIEYLVKKLLNLRVFEDENGKMNLSIQDIKGELLIVSQFTLYADCKKGNRPSFTGAAEPKFANEMYEKFIIECKKSNLKVQHGSFGADMKVSLLNDGPVTIILENETK